MIKCWPGDEGSEKGCGGWELLGAVRSWEPVDTVGMMKRGGWGR